MLVIRIRKLFLEYYIQDCSIRFIGIITHTHTESSYIVKESGEKRQERYYCQYVQKKRASQQTKEHQKAEATGLELYKVVCL